MEKNKRQSRRSVILTVVILAAAFIGLYVVNVGRVSADRSASSVLESQSTGAGNQAPQEVGMPAAVAMGSIIKMISALAVVIVCIYLGIYLLKRMTGKRRNVGGRHLLEVIETAYVGPKKTVSLVRVADKAVLIGVTDEKISMLTELDAQKTAEITAADMTETGESFSGFLKAASGRIRDFRLKKSRVALDN